MPNPNLYKELRDLQAKYKELAEKKEEPRKAPLPTFGITPFRPMRLDGITGKMRNLKDTTSHSSRNFSEQISIISTNGKHYLGINFDDGWWYIRATNSVV